MSTEIAKINFAYKYQKFLLELYNLIGLNWQKTPVIRAAIGDDYLHYLFFKNYVERSFWCTSFPARNKSDKLSHWWRITANGIYIIQITFGNIFKKEDRSIITERLLEF